MPPHPIAALRAGPDLPEHPAVRPHDGRGERHGGHALAPEVRAASARSSRRPRQRREERESRELARELLEFVGITGKDDEYARNLSYGDQRRLEVARALALRPKVLLLDEPTAGMNPQESARFVDFVHRVRDERGVSVLLIEHDMSVVMRVSERITVLDRGEKIAEGSPDGDQGQPAGDRGLPGQDRARRRQRVDEPAPTAGDAPARTRGHQRLLRQHRRREGPDDAGRRGDRHPDRLERRRQVDDAAHDLRADARQVRARSPSRARTSADAQGHEVVGEGIAHSPEGRRIFSRMTVDENLDLGAFSRTDKDEIAADREHVLELFPRLAERINQKAGHDVRRRAADARRGPGA